MPSTITVPIWVGSIILVVGYPALIIGVVLLVQFLDKVFSSKNKKKKGQK